MDSRRDGSKQFRWGCPDGHGKETDSKPPRSDGTALCRQFLRRILLRGIGTAKTVQCITSVRNPQQPCRLYSDPKADSRRRSAFREFHDQRQKHRTNGLGIACGDKNRPSHLSVLVTGASFLQTANWVEGRYPRLVRRHLDNRDSTCEPCPGRHHGGQGRSHRRTCAPAAAAVRCCDAGA